MTNARKPKHLYPVERPDGRYDVGLMRQEAQLYHRESLSKRVFGLMFVDHKPY